MVAGEKVLRVGNEFTLEGGSVGVDGGGHLVAHRIRYEDIVVVGTSRREGYLRVVVESSRDRLAVDYRDEEYGSSVAASIKERGREMGVLVD